MTSAASVACRCRGPLPDQAAALLPANVRPYEPPRVGSRIRWIRPNCDMRGMHGVVLKLDGPNWVCQWSPTHTESVPLYSDGAWMDWEYCVMQPLLPPRLPPSWQLPLPTSRQLSSTSFMVGHVGMKRGRDVSGEAADAGTATGTVAGVVVADGAATDRHFRQLNANCAWIEQQWDVHLDALHNQHLPGAVLALGRGVVAIIAWYAPTLGHAPADLVRGLCPAANQYDRPRSMTRAIDVCMSRVVGIHYYAARIVLYCEDCRVHDAGPRTADADPPTADVGPPTVDADPPTADADPLTADAHPRLAAGTDPDSLVLSLSSLDDGSVLDMRSVVAHDLDPFLRRRCIPRSDIPSVIDERPIIPSIEATHLLATAASTAVSAIHHIVPSDEQEARVLLLMKCIQEVGLLFNCDARHWAHLFKGAAHAYVYHQRVFGTALPHVWMTRFWFRIFVLAVHVFEMRFDGGDIDRVRHTYIVTRDRRTAQAHYEQLLSAAEKCPGVKVVSADVRIQRHDYHMLLQWTRGDAPAAASHILFVEADDHGNKMRGASGNLLVLDHDYATSPATGFLMSSFLVARVFTLLAASPAGLAHARFPCMVVTKPPNVRHTPAESSILHLLYNE